jgi:enoyl-CoA hydratase/carnithine racemase
MEAAPVISLALEPPLAVATLGRSPVNAIDEGWLAGLEAALSALERAPEAGVLLVRSSQRAFCAGADLALMRGRFDTAAGRRKMVALARRMQRAFARLEALPQATIAEIGGAALGGGLELALACDLRIAAEGAQLGLPEARLGLLPGAGGTQRLKRVIGEALARRLILRGEAISASEAAALGLAHWAVARDELESRARALALELAAIPPATLAACKRCLAARGAAGYAAELEATGALLASPATQALVRRFFERQH